MNNRNIKTAEFAGFCYGVKRAVETAKRLRKDYPEKNICVLGELIHNTNVIKELEVLGIKTIHEIPEKGDGICIIRSHGVAPAVIERIKNAGFEVVDLTCPDVKKVQQKAVELAKNNYFTVIIGKASHPEVTAIKANVDLYSDNAVVAETVAELLPYEQLIKSQAKIGIVVQTTQPVSSLNAITNYLNTISKEILIYNTICQSTAMRQREAKELAKESDIMIVVGSGKSANTNHLANILKNCTKTIHIEDDTELDMRMLDNVQTIGITAGASTPQEIIDKVILKIKEDSYDNN